MSYGYATVKRALESFGLRTSPGEPVTIGARSSYLESSQDSSCNSEESSKKARRGGACGRLREECLPLPLRCIAAAIHHVGIAERLEQRLGLASAAARSSVEHDRRCLVGRQEGDWNGRIGVPVPNDGVGRSRMLRALVWPAKVDHNGPRSDAANILWRGQNGWRRRR